jgi:hypothetical protein
MNHTRSGIIAVGAPHSLARYAAEAQNALDNHANLLLLTEEGVEIFIRFAGAVGCDVPVVRERGIEGDVIARWPVELNMMLRGIIFASGKA